MDTSTKEPEKEIKEVKEARAGLSPGREVSNFNQRAP